MRHGSNEFFKTRLKYTLFIRFTLWETQFRNKSYDEDDEKKRHILDEV